MHVACPPLFFPVNLRDPTGADGVAVRLLGDVAKW